jgi:hypothetical protein
MYILINHVAISAYFVLQLIYTYWDAVFGGERVKLAFRFIRDICLMIPFAINFLLLDHMHITVDLIKNPVPKSAPKEYRLVPVIKPPQNSAIILDALVPDQMPGKVLDIDTRMLDTVRIVSQ